MAAGLAIHPPVHLTIHHDEPIRTVDDALKVIERHAGESADGRSQDVMAALARARTPAQVESAATAFRRWAYEEGLLLVPPEDV